MLFQFIKNQKQSTFKGERITDKSFRATALTDFQVSVTKNLLETFDRSSFISS